MKYATRHRMHPTSFATMMLLAAGLAAVVDPSLAADDKSLAFDDRFMFRISSYAIQNADTDIAVADSATGLGVAYSFRDDFGGDDSVTVPRIDAMYRFNDRHRIEFAYFDYDRGGSEILELEVDLGEDTFSIGDRLDTDIRYELFKVAYAYSFYRSEQVELGFSAGLNVTTYEVDYQLADGSEGDTVDASGPLPMFGLRMSYSISPKWSLHYISEAFYIEIEDTFKGSFTTSEIDVEYRFNRHFTLGAGITRFSTDLDADDSDWKGSISDSHRGLLGYATFYL